MTNGTASIDATPPVVFQGGEVNLRATPQDPARQIAKAEWEIVRVGRFLTQEVTGSQSFVEAVYEVPSDLPPSTYTFKVTLTLKPAGGGANTASGTKSRGTTTTTDVDTGEIEVEVQARAFGSGDQVAVTMRRTDAAETDDQAFWVAIRNATNRISFNRYQSVLDRILCGEEPHSHHGQAALKFREFERRRALPFPDLDQYRLLKVATEVFLLFNAGVPVDLDNTDAPFDNVVVEEERRRLGRGQDSRESDEEFLERIEEQWTAYISSRNGDRVTGEEDLGLLPYLAVIRLKFPELGLADDNDFGRKCYGILQRQLNNPLMIELIWSYWHEEGMLVQAVNALCRRFQNVLGSRKPDPLAHVEVDPLRPLNNLIWGFVQDEQHRLTVPRRAYEYDHHYGLTILGKAVPRVRGADSRSRFLDGFHNLLNLAANFYKEDDDTTVIADAFPLLNGLKEVHLLLTEGQHNQYGDLPWQARQEMLMQEWLLARPEVREFLPGRIMVAYPEGWMDAVDTMKRLQDWTDTSIMHFRDLGVFGEQILLSVRFGHWNPDRVLLSENAANWARYWRPEIQGYIHAYRAVTGVDLTLDPVDSTMPAVHLRRRLAAQLEGKLPAATLDALDGRSRAPRQVRSRRAPAQQLEIGMPPIPLEMPARAQLPSHADGP